MDRTTCKDVGPQDFLASKVAAGQSVASVLADLDDQEAEGAATLAALGSSTFTTAFQGQTLSPIQTSLGATTPVAVTGAAKSAPLTDATIH